MVWELVNVDKAAVPSSYLFTSSGAYKVGRKDCAIIVQSDKSISRIHAEIQVPSSTPFRLQLPIPTPILKDLSKFGTFINKDVGNSKPIFSFPNKESHLQDGDHITFGTANATFRLKHIPLLFCFLCKNERDPFHDHLASLGAYAFEDWSHVCTHLIVDNTSLVNEIVLTAVVEKKPVILLDWISALVARSPATKWPSLASYLPTLKFQAVESEVLVNVVEPDARGHTFQDILFLFGPLHMYKYREHLQHLVDVGGGRMAFLSDYSTSLQATRQSSPNQQLVVIPQGMTSKSLNSLEGFGTVPQLQKVNEASIIVSILCGNLDISPHLPQGTAQSMSTEDTVDVQDSEDEDVSSLAKISQLASTVSSTPSKMASEPIANASDNQITGNESTLGSNMFKFKKGTHIELQSLQSVSLKMVRVEDDTSAKKEAGCGAEDTPFLGNVVADIKYDAELIVRRDCTSSSDIGSNFKRFKKVGAASGNSFSALVPFAKEPYRELAYEREVEEYARQEKKRKEAEALAEDLFNAQQLKKKKGVLGGVVKEHTGRRTLAIK